LRKIPTTVGSMIDPVGWLGKFLEGPEGDGGDLAREMLQVFAEALIPPDGDNESRRLGSGTRRRTTQTHPITALPSPHPENLSDPRLNTQRISPAWGG
jgi:hypothetical protein